MTTDSREAYERGLQMLAGWMKFLEEKEQELQQQLEKARQAAASGSAPQAPASGPEDWLDESPPRAAAPPSAAPDAQEPEDGAKAGRGKRRRATEDAGAPAASVSDEDELPDWLKE